MPLNQIVMNYLKTMIKQTTVMEEDLIKNMILYKLVKMKIKKIKITKIKIQKIKMKQHYKINRALLTSKPRKLMKKKISW